MRVRAVLPGEGAYRLSLHVLHEEQRMEACHFLLLAPAPSDKESARLQKWRRWLKEAIQTGSEQTLRKVKAEFKAYAGNSEDLLQEADDKLELLRLQRNLRDAIKRRNATFLESTIAQVMTSHHKEALGGDVRKAELLLQKLQPLDGFAQPTPDLSQTTISEIMTYVKPRDIVHDVMAAVLVLLGEDPDFVEVWFEVKGTMSRQGQDRLGTRLRTFDLREVTPERAEVARAHLQSHSFEAARAASLGIAAFYEWARLAITRACQIADEAAMEVDPVAQQSAPQDLPQDSGQHSRAASAQPEATNDAPSVDATRQDAESGLKSEGEADSPLVADTTHGAEATADQSKPGLETSRDATAAPDTGPAAGQLQAAGEVSREIVTPDSVFTPDVPVQDIWDPLEASIIQNGRDEVQEIKGNNSHSTTIANAERSETPDENILPVSGETPRSPSPPRQSPPGKTVPEESRPITFSEAASGRRSSNPDKEVRGPSPHIRVSQEAAKVEEVTSPPPPTPEAPPGPHGGQNAEAEAKERLGSDQGGETEPERSRQSTPPRPHSDTARKARGDDGMDANEETGHSSEASLPRGDSRQSDREEDVGGKEDENEDEDVRENGEGTSRPSTRESIAAVYAMQLDDVI